MPTHLACGLLVLVMLAPALVAAEPTDGQSDFDFIIGTWKIKNHMLRTQPDGTQTWYEFDSTSTNRAIWEGKANVEEWDGVGPRGRIQGVAVRLYDPVAHQWSIYWGDRRQGVLGVPPVVGRFRDGRGELYSDGTYEGKKSRDRVMWSRITKDSCRWEQAMSLDGGKTWKTNWIMDFTRTAP
jgi:hypothetical protein